MASVRELSDPYANVMLNPLPASAPDVCRVCLTFTSGGFATCYPCGHQPEHADAVLPVSYSVHFGQLHTALAGYKRYAPVAARPLRAAVAAVLWRFLAGHERCLALRSGVTGFQVVATVPSGAAERDEAHPLRDIVGGVVGSTRERHRRLLTRSDVEVADRVVDPAKYQPTTMLSGQHVLLIDDTWTTGANAQSAAAAPADLALVGTGSRWFALIQFRCDPLQHSSDRLALVWAYRHAIDAGEEDVYQNEPSFERLLGEVPVARPAGGALGEDEVVLLKAERPRPSLGRRAGRDIDRHEPVLPPCRRLGGFRPDAVRVVAVRPMERRPVADCAVDLFRLLRTVDRIDVGLDRAQERLRCIRESSEDRLAPHDDEFVLVGDVGRGADDVLQFVPLH